MAKIFMIDSENVGASWIQLLPALSGEDQIFVFYTDKSPYVSYENMLQVIKYGSMPVFIKCFEGTNALDFQLVSEMGYKLCENPEGEFIIISDDYGYDAAVKYWTKKGYNIRRIGKKGCKYQSEAALRPERREFVPVEIQSQPEKTEPTQAAAYQAMVQKQTTEANSTVAESSTDGSTAVGSSANDYAVSDGGANSSSANGGAYYLPFDMDGSQKHGGRGQRRPYSRGRRGRQNTAAEGRQQYEEAGRVSDKEPEASVENTLQSAAVMPEVAEPYWTDEAKAEQAEALQTKEEAVTEEIVMEAENLEPASKAQETVPERTTSRTQEATSEKVISETQGADLEKTVSGQQESLLGRLHAQVAEAAGKAAARAVEETLSTENQDGEERPDQTADVQTRVVEFSDNTSAPEKEAVAEPAEGEAKKQPAKRGRKPSKSVAETSKAAKPGKKAQTEEEKEPAKAKSSSKKEAAAKKPAAKKTSERKAPQKKGAAAEAATEAVEEDKLSIKIPEENKNLSAEEAKPVENGEAFAVEEAGAAQGTVSEQEVHSQQKENSVKEEGSGQEAVPAAAKVPSKESEKPSTPAKKQFRESVKKISSKEELQEELALIAQSCGSTRPAEDAACAMRVFESLSMERLIEVNTSLKLLIGNELGNSIYKEIKNHPEYREQIDSMYVADEKQRFKQYVQVILERSELKDVSCGDISRFLTKIPRKNLLSIRTAMLKEYGRDLGIRIYAAFKPHMKILNSILG